MVKFISQGISFDVKPKKVFLSSIEMRVECWCDRKTRYKRTDVWLARNSKVASTEGAVPTRIKTGVVDRSD